MSFKSTHTMQRKTLPVNKTTCANVHDPPRTCQFYQMCIQNFMRYLIWLKTYFYFHIFTFLASALPSTMKIGILKAHWLDLVCINSHMKNYQSYRNGSRVMSMFAKCPQTSSQTVHRRFTNYTRTDGQVDYKTLFDLTVSTFLLVMLFK